MRPRPDLLAAGLACALASSAIAVIAFLSVHVLDAQADAARWFAFDLNGPPGRSEAAVEIALNNLRLATAPLLGAVAITSTSGTRLLIDLVLGALLVGNAALIGSAVAAYGAPVLRSLAIHGPIELAGFSIAGAVYVAARRRRPTVRKCVVSGALVVVFLTVAAVLETWLRIG